MKVIASATLQSRWRPKIGGNNAFAYALEYECVSSLAHGMVKIAIGVKVMPISRRQSGCVRIVRGIHTYYECICNGFSALCTLTASDKYLSSTSQHRTA